jgi:predicted aspartyl protease
MKRVKSIQRRQISQPKLETLGVAIALLILAFVRPGAAATVYSNPIENSESNLVFTRLKINGKEVRALIDSGSFRSVQLSGALAEELRLPLTDTETVARRYEGKDLHLRTGQIATLVLGEFEQHDVAVHVIEGDIENIAKQVHTDFQVILGWGFLSQFCIAMDYVHLTMQWSDSSLSLGTERWKTSFAVVNNAPVVDGVVDGQKIRFLLDTGAPTCTMDTSLVAESSAGPITKSATIEANTFSVNWKVKDLSAIKKSLGCLGVLGNNFLKTYTVYFVPKERMIYFY